MHDHSNPIGPLIPGPVEMKRFPYPTYGFLRDYYYFRLVFVEPSSFASFKLGQILNIRDSCAPLQNVLAGRKRTWSGPISISSHGRCHSWLLPVQKTSLSSIYSLPLSNASSAESGPMRPLYKWRGHCYCTVPPWSMMSDNGACDHNYCSVFLRDGWNKQLSCTGTEKQEV